MSDGGFWKGCLAEGAQPPAERSAMRLLAVLAQEPLPLRTASRSAEAGLNTGA